ncbi:hypothetical protein DL95DRAFT_470889 [Leptodontidium sp. 2 PMI_412]|nr:hypothetical protein DL95DRAFT_470889 [Leptodontidium sp. 2 PMI_412]
MGASWISHWYSQTLGEPLTLCTQRYTEQGGWGPECYCCRRWGGVLVGGAVVLAMLPPPPPPLLLPPGGGVEVTEPSEKVPSPSPYIPTQYRYPGSKGLHMELAF